jgi:hypothetical protein
VGAREDYIDGLDEPRLAESYAKRLPKASIGTSCVRFTRPADVDTAVLTELIAEAARLGPADAAGV